MINKAIEAHKKALKLDERTLESYASLGGIYRELEEYQTAEFYLRKALEITLAYMPALIPLAASMKSTGKLEEATKLYEQIIHEERFLISGISITAHVGYAASLRKLSKLDKTKQIYDFVLQQKPHQEYALTGYGYVLLDLKEYTKAKEIFEKALRINPYS